MQPSKIKIEPKHYILQNKFQFLVKIIGKYREVVIPTGVYGDKDDARNDARRIMAAFVQIPDEKKTV